METYNAVEYWSKNTEDILESEEEIDKFRVHRLHKKFILAALTPVRSEIKSVFEIGCGYGRITKVLLDNFPEIEHYNAIDVSPAKIEGAIRYIPKEKYSNKLRIWNDDFLRIKPLSNYDLVIATEVLMHQTPSDIKLWCEKMNALSNKFIINIDWYEKNPRYPRGIAPHNFIHEYDDIYAEIMPNARVISTSLQPITKQRFYFIVKQ